ncbi:MAG: pectinacetylesterase family protein [Anaerolineae bacterium]|jgi:hypothetical protein|nr:pectinacetylesterase family protein [Anaerolineae bacterium]
MNLKRPLFLVLLVTLFLVMLTVINADDESDLPVLADLEEGWNVLAPAGETGCSRETPFQFFARPASVESDKVMIYFQGGGACWNDVMCSRDNATFDDAIGTPEQELGFYNGIFDFENEDNPVADYHAVFVPYCTADVHIGDAIVEYGQYEIHHNGFNNTSAVLDWVYHNFSDPSQILITGSSAGAYGAIYYAPFVIEQYPNARVVQFGDAGAGVTPIGWPVLTSWNIYDNLPDFVEPFEAITPENFTINALYTGSATQYPDQTFAQFTNAADEVQIFFHSISAANITDPWQDLMYANFDQLETDHANFRAYIAGGTEHTILARPEFYTVISDEVLFRDWFADLLAGEDVENVRCLEEDCLTEAVIE